MPDAPRNIRNAIKSFIPNWLARVSGFSCIYAVALACDEFVEQMFQGVLAPLPGIGTPTALDLIGQGRALPRGLGESDDAYAARLPHWIDVWTNAGSAETLVQQIQVALGGNLVVCLIDRKQTFVTVAADGTTSKTTDVDWNWDGNTTDYFGPPNNRTFYWSDMWLVVHATDGRWPTYTSLTDPAWVAAWGTYQGFGTGLKIPRDAADALTRIVALFKGAHTWLAAIILTDSAVAFSPGFVAAVPNGNYGNWSFDSGGTQVPARFTDGGGFHTRYMIPPAGG